MSSLLEHKEWLTTTEVAEYLGVSTQTVRRWKEEHGLPLKKWSHRTWKVEKNELEEWARKERA